MTTYKKKRKKTKDLPPGKRRILQILAEVLSRNLTLEEGAKIGGYTKRSLIELSKMTRKRLNVKSNLEAIRIGLKKGWINESKLPCESIRTFKKTGKFIFPLVPTQREISYLKKFPEYISAKNYKAHKSVPLTRLRKIFKVKTDSGVVLKAVKLGWVEMPPQIIEFCSQLELAQGKLSAKNIMFLTKITQGFKEGKMLIEIYPKTDYSTQRSFFNTLTRIRQRFGVSSAKELIKLGQDRGWLE